MIKAIIFDIGGVLVFTDFPRIYEEFAKRSGIDPQFVNDYHRKHIKELLLGSITLEHFFEAMAAVSKKPGRDLQNTWLEVGLSHRKVNQESIDFLLVLRKKYLIGALSDLSPHRKLMDEAMGLYSLFDYKILSCEKGLKKPDPKFFVLALKAAEAQPSEAIFIDDNIRYTEAASELGIKSICYVDNLTLKKELRAVLKQ